MSDLKQTEASELEYIQDQVLKYGSHKFECANIPEEEGICTCGFGDFLNWILNQRSQQTPPREPETPVLGGEEKWVTDTAEPESGKS